MPLFLPVRSFMVSAALALCWWGGGKKTAAFGEKQPLNPQRDPCQSKEQIPAPEPSVGLAAKRFCQLGSCVWSKPGTAQRAAPGPPGTAPRSDGERQPRCTHLVPSLGFASVLDYNLAAAQATAARGTGGGAGCCSSICTTAASSSSLPWVWARNCLFWGSTRGGGCSTWCRLLILSHSTDVGRPVPAGLWGREQPIRI